jgi:purine catabolism regulator
LLMIDGLELRRSKARIVAYIDRIVAADVSALAIGIGAELPFARVPHLLVAACESAGLTLVSVPSTTPFAQVAEAVYSRLAQERFGEAPMLVEAQRALTRAAASPASSAAVVATLARLTDLTVMLCDIEGHLVASAPEIVEVPVEIARKMAQMVPQALRGAAVVPAGEAYLRVQPIGAVSLLGFVAYGPQRGSVSDFQAAAGSLAASLLSIDLERQHEVRALQRRPREEAARRLARGVAPAVAQQLLTACGLQLDRVKVAVIEPTLIPLADAVNRVADLLPEALVTADRSVVLVVAPADLDDLTARLATGLPEWSMGLGGSVRPQQCPVSLIQARQGLQLARQRGGGLVDVMTLASARMLLSGVSPDMLRSYADATLRPLESPEDGDMLLGTLRAWLAACGVAETAAAAVGVHRHTLRHRLHRIESLTGRRLDDAHDRGELWLAFEVRDLAAVAE